jgi:hypothetical protein
MIIPLKQWDLAKEKSLEPEHARVEESKIANLRASKTATSSLALRENAVKSLFADEFEHPLHIGKSPE